MEHITEWVKSVFIMITAVSFLEMLIPSGEMEKYVKYVFAIIILATVLMPAFRLIA